MNWLKKLFVSSVEQSNDSKSRAKAHLLSQETRVDLDAVPKMKWEIMFEISLDDGTTHQFPVRGQLGREPPFEGENGKNFRANVQAAFFKFTKSMMIAYEMDSSLEMLAPEFRLDFTTNSMAAQEDGVLVVNPDFLNMHDTNALAVILIHEYRHFQLDHNNRCKKFLSELPESEPQPIWRKAFNAGADLEVNSELQQAMERAGIRGNSLVPGFGNYQDFPSGLKAEEYACQIMIDPQLKTQMEDRVADETSTPWTNHTGPL